MEAATEAVAVRRAFRKFDEDGSGAIDVGELQALLAELGAEFTPLEVAEVMRLVDTDNSGVISEQEFVDWWTGAERFAGRGRADL